MKYDFLVIGAGIAGSSTAYFLKEAGYKVLVVEKNSICSGGSFGAGAFLSPKLSKPSRYKDYLNEALRFSLDFYAKNFPSLLKKVALHKYPIDEKDYKKLQSYEEFIDFEYEKKNGFYKLDFAGFIDPQKLCQALLKDIDVLENREVTKENLHDFCAKNIIIAYPNQALFKAKYLKTKDIGGYRYDVRFSGCEDKGFNSHKDCSISCFHNNKIAIGATYIKDTQNLEDDAKTDKYNLLQKAQNFFKMQELEVLQQYTGVRNMSFDFFPIVGKLIDEKATLSKYPYIKNGSKVPSSKYIYHENVYIHTALGSRGFVYAPYNSMLLVDMIVKNKEIENYLSPERSFLKYSRKL